MSIVTRNMGAKVPAKVKLRRPMYKCDVCDRKLLSAQALKTHQHCVHKSVVKPVPKAKARANVKIKKVVAKPKAAVNKSKEEVAPEVPINEPQVSKVVKPTAKDAATDLMQDLKQYKHAKVSDVRRIEFECPQCLILFPAYFPAFRHIQKHMKDIGENSSEENVPKPNRVEVCIKCNTRIRSSDIHTCNDAMLMEESGFLLKYECTGCPQVFNSIQMYDLHVSGQHCDGVESMFFPNIKEFLAWKDEMESECSMKYLVLGKCNSKQTFRCTYLPTWAINKNSTIKICPSSIVIQELSKGIQVHFYKQHFGHRHSEYILPAKYKEYSITTLMEQEPEEIVIGTDNLYRKFKLMMEGIIIAAKDVRHEKLEILKAKALEMNTIIISDDLSKEQLQNYKSLTDNQITTALEKMKDTTVKRQAPLTSGSDVKRRRLSHPEMLSPKILNSFSMATKSDNDDDTKSKMSNQSPSTFNDSYKDFVDKNFLSKTDDKAAKNVAQKPKPLSKAKPSPDVRKVKGDTEKSKSKDEKVKFKDELLKERELPPKVKETPKAKGPPKLKEPLKSKELPKARESPKVRESPKLKEPAKLKEPSKAKEPSKVKETPKLKEAKVKKNLVKTRIGQFKPSLSPKKPDLNKSVDKVRIDFDYEVKEQENDCNILILKI